MQGWLFRYGVMTCYDDAWVVFGVCFSFFFSFVFKKTGSIFILLFLFTLFSRRES